MPTIEHAGYDIEVTPYVEEAVSRLGIFKPEAIPYLADGVARFMNHGKIAYQLRRTGKELNDDEKSENGLTKRTRMSRAFWEALTEEGRADPVKKPEIVFRRVTSNLYNEGKHRQLDDSYANSMDGYGLSFWNVVMIQRIDARCCAASKKLEGKHIPTPERPRLPLAECDRDVCLCSYDVTAVRREQRERNPVPSTRAEVRPPKRRSLWSRLFG